MPSSRPRLLLVAMLVGLLASVGCGGPESGTHVQVDKAKEDAVLKGMGSYHLNKKQGKAGARPNR